MTHENLLARYRILQELGRGATGVVYSARDRENGAVVALKRFDPALLGKSGAGFAEQLVKHARSARLLKHRNIVETHGAVEVGGTVYVAMERLEGRNLRQMLDEGPLPVARALEIARDIACALAHAHLQGVVHGGLKPSNVLVSTSGVAKIGDFGVGQLARAALLSGAPAGRPSYLSPEQLRGDPADHRCDIFSAGAMLYEMLANRRPFEGGSAKELLQNILHGKPPLPSELNPHAPRALDAIVLSMLAAQPALRMPGAPILLRDLKRLEEGLGLASSASAIAAAVEPTATVPPAQAAAAPARAPAPPPARPARVPAPPLAAERIPAPPPAAERTPAPRVPDPDRFRHADRTADAEAFDYQKAMAMIERESRRERSSGARPVAFAALVLAVLGVGVAGFMYASSHPGQWSIAVARMQEALATALEPSRPPPPPPVAEATQEPAPVVKAAEEPAPVVKAVEQPAPVVVRAPEAPEAPAPPAAAPAPPAAAPAPAPAPVPPAKTAAKATEPQPDATARLILAISPRGELYIDGKHHGTTPPLTTFDIEPGMHRIEVRSGSYTPYLTYVMLEAGDVRRIRHDFDVSRAVYPRAGSSWRNNKRAAR